MLWGVAEDHDSNPIKLGLGKLKARGAKIVAINPVRTGYGAIADEWIGIRPGTDGLFAFALIHELLRADRIDLDYLVRYTNAHWLVIAQSGRRGRRAVRARCGRRAACAALALRHGEADSLRRESWRDCRNDESRRRSTSPADRRRIHPARRPQGGARHSTCSPNAISIRNTRPTRVQRTLRHPRRHDPPHRARTRRTPRSTRRSACRSRGPTRTAASTTR